MNIEDYREFCLALGDVEEKLPFAGIKGGESVLVFYVHEHMFACLDCDEYTSVSLKCQPERIEELKLQYDGIIGTASHMNPKYWIGVNPDCGHDDLLRDLTRNSYEIVKSKYKAKK